MTVNEIIINALSPFGLSIDPNFDGGGKEEYITFNYADDTGECFADDAPTCVVAYMQIHYFLPIEKNYLQKKKELRNALFDAGFTYPEVTVLTEGKTRHIIFECEIENEDEMEE